LSTQTWRIIKLSQAKSLHPSLDKEFRVEANASNYTTCQVLFYSIEDDLGKRMSRLPELIIREYDFKGYTRLRTKLSILDNIY